MVISYNQLFCFFFQIFQQFLLDYPVAKNISDHLAFYLSQLNYELQPGRKSAMLMIESLVKAFPQVQSIIVCELKLIFQWCLYCYI